MIGRVLLHSEVPAKPGAGGVGEDCLAEDRRLGRCGSRSRSRLRDEIARDGGDDLAGDEQSERCRDQSEAPT